MCRFILGDELLFGGPSAIRENKNNNNNENYLHLDDKIEKKNYDKKYMFAFGLFRKNKTQIRATPTRLSEKNKDT